MSVLSEWYALAIVSLLVRGDFDAGVDERDGRLRQGGIGQYFSAILFARADKDELYRTAWLRLHSRPEGVVFVDDREVRGVTGGNRHGASTIWLRRGSFADALSNDDTGAPTHPGDNLAQLLEIL